MIPNVYSRYILIGPEKDKKNPHDTGGTVVSYTSLLAWFKTQQIQFISIDTNSKNYLCKLTAYLNFVFKLIIHISHYDIVMFNASDYGFKFGAPVVVFLSKVVKKKCVLRLFGGSFDKFYENCGLFSKKIVNWSINNASATFWQTKALLEFGKTFNNKNSFWFPNIRFSQDKSEFNEKLYTYKKRFCFISHICKGKGVFDLYEAAKHLPDDYAIDIYGEIYEQGIEFPPVTNNSIVTYKGALPPEKVIKTLQNYDCLLLPTQWPGEGYPGIILEAFSAGVPVITNRWMAVPEIVDDGEDGILCEPGNTEDLYKAILSLDDTKIKKMKAAALKKFAQFDAEKVYPRIFGIIEGL